MGLINKQQESTGSDILAEVNFTLDSLSAQAATRNEVVEERLRALEAEQADLRQAQRRLDAARSIA